MAGQLTWTQRTAAIVATGLAMTAGPAYMWWGGGGGEPPINEPDSGIHPDVGPDAQADVGPDAQPDVGPDVGPDAAVDAGGGGNFFSLDFPGNSVSNTELEDELTIACHDAATSDQPCNVGAGSFTVDLWLNCSASDNTNDAGGSADSESTDYTPFTTSNIFFDRDVWLGTCAARKFGAGLTNNRVMFAVGEGTNSTELNIQGSTTICDDTWHHVTLVLDQTTTTPDTTLRIYVDGALDYASTTALPDGDWSIPDSTCTAGNASSAARNAAWVFGGEKHGFDDISYNGLMARVRVFDVAKTTAQVAAIWDREIECADDTDLVGRWDLSETGSANTTAVEECGRSPNGVVDLGGGSTAWDPDGPTILAPGCVPCGGGQECCDCVDNDGDGLTDWAGGDMACTQGPTDTSETPSADQDSIIAGVQNEGWTVFEPDDGTSVVCHVDSVNGSGTWPCTEASPCDAVSDCNWTGASSNSAPDFLLLARNGSYGSLSGLAGGESVANAFVIVPTGDSGDTPPVVTAGVENDNTYVGGTRTVNQGPGAWGGLGAFDNVWIEGLDMEGPDTGIALDNGGEEYNDVRVAWSLFYNQTSAGSNLFVGDIDGWYFQYNLTDFTNTIEHGIYTNRIPTGRADRVIDNRYNLVFSEGSALDGLKIRPGGTAVGNVQWAPSQGGGYGMHQMGSCSDGEGPGSLCGTGFCGPCLGVMMVENVACADGDSIVGRLDGNQYDGIDSRYSMIRDTIGTAGGCIVQTTAPNSGTESNNVTISATPDGSRSGYNWVDLYHEDILSGSSGTGGAEQFLAEVVDNYEWHNVDKLYTADCLLQFARLLRDEEAGDGYTSADASQHDAGDYACTGYGFQTSETEAGFVYKNGYPDGTEPECNDGVDNDNDGFVDHSSVALQRWNGSSFDVFADTDCSSAADNDESSGGGGDAGPPDAQADAGPDAQADVGPDAQADAQADAGPDAQPDASGDAGASTCTSATAIAATGNRNHEIFGGTSITADPFLTSGTNYVDGSGSTGEFLTVSVSSYDTAVECTLGTWGGETATAIDLDSGSGDNCADGSSASVCAWYFTAAQVTTVGTGNTMVATCVGTSGLALVFEWADGVDDTNPIDFTATVTDGNVADPALNYSPAELAYGICANPLGTPGEAAATLGSGTTMRYDSGGFPGYHDRFLDANGQPIEWLLPYANTSCDGSGENCGGDQVDNVQAVVGLNECTP